MLQSSVLLETDASGYPVKMKNHGILGGGCQLSVVDRIPFWILLISR